MKLLKWGYGLRIVVLLFMTVGTYWGVLQNDFVDFDDNIYVTQNRYTREGLSTSSFQYAWTTFDSGNWIPLTWLSYQLNSTILGSQPWSYHSINLAFHAMNVVLLFIWLNQLTSASGRSFVVAALFAVHPLHVESVAWIAERKDVLSTFWLLTSLIAYERFCAHFSVGCYLATCIAFAMGLLSKSMVVTLPLLMLILDFWPLQRVDFSKTQQEKTHKYPVRNFRILVMEKVPLFGLSLIVGVITIMAQDAGHAVGDQTAGSALSRLPITIRIGNSLVGYWWYIAKTFWPAGLCVYYPHPREALDATGVFWAGLILALFALAVIIAGRSRPYLVCGGLWFMVSLLPVIGIIQVGSQAYADRYSYVPQIGLLWMIVWECHFWMQRFAAGRFLGLVAASVTILALCWTTVVQVTFWKSTDTLWKRVLAVDPENWFAHLQIGNRRVMNGQPDETAYRHLMIALEGSPANPYALNNLGWIFQNRAEWDEAGKYYRRAIKADPSMTQAMHNLIFVLKKQGRLADESQFIEDYARKRLNDAWVINELGMIAVRQGQMEKASAWFEQSLLADPHQRDAQVNLALVLSQLGKDREARSNLEAVLTRYPDDGNSHVNLGLVLERLGQYSEARQQYAEALRCNPQDREASQRLQILDKSLSQP